MQHVASRLVEIQFFQTNRVMTLIPVRARQLIGPAAIHFSLG